MSKHRVPPSESDLQQLNALADGELDAESAAAWRTRIESEPQVAQAYDQIIEVKSRLKALAPGPDVASAAMDRDRGWTGPARWAIAASIAAALLVGGAWFGSRTFGTVEPRGLEAWHSHLSAQEYVVKNYDGPLFVSLGGADIPVPDLQPSKLYLVDTRVIENGSEGRTIMHYRGLRGCRLTIWSGPAGNTPLPTNASDARHWMVGNTRFGIIATGMDPDRFASVADYVESVTGQLNKRRNETRVAMGTAYQTAKSCA